jgi:hypothetical protein
MPLPAPQRPVEEKEPPEPADLIQAASGGSMLNTGDQVPFVQVHT